MKRILLTFAACAAALAGPAAAAAPAMAAPAATTQSGPIRLAQMPPDLPPADYGRGVTITSAGKVVLSTHNNANFTMVDVCMDGDPCATEPGFFTFYFKHGMKYLHADATHAWMGPKPQLFGAYGGSGFGYGRYFLRADKATNAPLASHVGLTARWRKLVTAWADPQSPQEGHRVNPTQVWTMAPRP